MKWSSYTDFDLLEEDLKEDKLIDLEKTVDVITKLNKEEIGTTDQEIIKDTIFLSGLPCYVIEIASTGQNDGYPSDPENQIVLIDIPLEIITEPDEEYEIISN